LPIFSSSITFFSFFPHNFQPLSMRYQQVYALLIVGQGRRKTYKKLTLTHG
jgi:hypothetical protein